MISPGDPQFERLVEKYKPVRVTPQRAALRFDVVRITPTSAVHFDTNLSPEKFGIYQQWERRITAVSIPLIPAGLHGEA